MRPAQVQLGVRRFLRWWGQGLVAWLPPSLRRSGLAGRPLLCLAVVGSELVVSLRRRDVERELLRVGLGEVDPDQARRELLTGLPRRCRTLLQLAPAQAVTTTLDLPAATDAELRQLVLHQIEHVSPFQRDQVHYGYRAQAGAAAGGGLRIDLTLVPRTGVAAVLDTAHALGLYPEALVVPGGVEVPLPVAEPALRRLCRRLNPVLAGLLLLLLVAIAALPLLGQRQQIAQLRQAVADQAALAQQVDERRRELQRLSGEAGMLYQRRREATSSLSLVTALSRALDDHTYLQRLELRGDGLQLQGVSKSAVTVLAALEPVPNLAGAHFTGPITRATDGSESFRVSARVGAVDGPQEDRPRQ